MSLEEKENAGITSSTFTRKLDPKEQAKMNTMMSNMNKQATQFITNEVDINKTLDRQGETSTNTGLDLKTIPTLYFKGCRDCDYVIEHRTTKVLIEDCHNTKFTFNNTILTSTLEAWKCKHVSISSSLPIKTMQLDLSSHVQFTLPSLSDFGTIVHNSLEQLSLCFINTPQHNLVTGFTHMHSLFPDSNVIIDQFIIRVIDDTLCTERCIRLKNGFLSTEREAVEWDKKNARLQDAFVATFLKESGLTLNRKQEKQIPPNDVCPLCTSGKKYKKCCFNKQVLTGVDGEVKAEIYKKA